MSTIVGIVDEDKAVLAADKRGSLGGVITEPINKITRLERPPLVLAFAWAGSPLDADMLKRVLTERMPRSADALQDSALTLYERLKNIGRIVPNERDSNTDTMSSTFLIASTFGLFAIEFNGYVRPIDGFWTIGSGSDFALGAVRAYRAIAPETPATEIARCAVEISASFDLSTGGGVDVEVVELQKKTGD